MWTDNIITIIMLLCMSKHGTLQPKTLPLPNYVYRLDNRKKEKM